MKIRNSSIELLRIICMFGIVFMHAFGYVYQDDSYRIASLLENGLFNNGVTILVLISGYYGIKTNFKKIINFELIVYWINLLTLIVLMVFRSFEFKGSLKALMPFIFPFLSGNNRFYSGFIILMILAPFINKYYNQLDKDMYKIQVFLLTLFFYIAPCLTFNNYNADYGKGFAHYFIVYIIGKYISRFYNDFKSVNNRWYILVFILNYLIAFTLNFIVSSLLDRNYIFFSIDNSIFILFQSICIFIIFSRFSFYNKIINKISSYNFTIFLLNSVIISYVFRSNVLQFIAEHSSIDNVIFLFGVAILSYIICIIVEIARRFFLTGINKRIINFLNIKIRSYEIVKKYLNFEYSE